VNGTSAPPGYESFLVGRAQVVARSAVAGDVRVAMSGGTLHDWASRVPGARAMHGRGTTWATALPGGLEIAVRHSRHGGLLAPLTGDRFLRPTRAPAELAASLRLAEGGVTTPEVVAYAVYPAGGPFARADVATRFLAGATLPDAWRATATEPARWALIGVLARLLASLAAVGARHPDLNAKNVLVLDGAQTAAVLDVDRVTFASPGDRVTAELNVDRLLHSMAKLHVGWGVNLTARQVQQLRGAAGGAA
jgi:3-deoxy-D-manno-octulosonic acid kinase